MKPAPRSQRATRPAAKAYAGDRKPCEVCVATLIPVALVLAVACALGAPTQQGTPASFASRIEALSETGGHFDTDNLISNERSYLHVAPALRELRSDAGAYIGVGPDQNFSYIAHVRPSIAIIIDIRRDNLLLHLLFKALFELAPSRTHYLALLTGRGRPAPAVDWTTQSIDDLTAYLDVQQRLDATELTSLTGRVTETIDSFGVRLSEADHRTILRFHRRFIGAGLSLQFNSTGRAPRWGYPTYRDLLLENDRDGVRRSYMASEDDFQFVKSLQARGLVIPVVGDLSGPTAVAAVGRFLAERGDEVSAFYTSNIEFYLFRQGSFGRFVANLARVPHGEAAVIIRSAFRNVMTDPGYNSASMTQSIPALVNGHTAGEFRQYAELLAASQ